MPRLVLQRPDPTQLQSSSPPTTLPLTQPTHSPTRSSPPHLLFSLQHRGTLRQVEQRLGGRFPALLGHGGAGGQGARLAQRGIQGRAQLLIGALQLPLLGLVGWRGCMRVCVELATGVVG